jgi:hypothetical protein
MKIRRVVTGHDNQRSVVVADEELDGMPLGPRGGDGWVLWGRDDTAKYPDDGNQGERTAMFPPVGGCRMVILRLSPGRAGLRRTAWVRLILDVAIPSISRYEF